MAKTWGILFIAPRFFLPQQLNRYVHSLPYGFMVESILLLTYVVLFFKHFKKLDFSRAKNPVVILMLLWMAYIVLQLGNPQAPSKMAWAYAMRGIALFQLLLIPLVFILFKTKKDLINFVTFYFILSLLGILWAIKQHTTGLTQTEIAGLLASGGYKTHVLFGKLRVFSIYFDAGTFGAAMGHLCIISALLYIGPFKKLYKTIFLIVALASFYAMMVSGTRGALAVPGIGAMVYVILIKNIKYITLGVTVMAFTFIFLKFTTIGHSNYDVQRLRTALDPEDSSLNVRLKNRQRLSVYLEGKPFGGGVGSVGGWGQQFSPGTWLANFPPDGLYTRIRAETGIVGYSIYLIVWLYILYLGFKACWNMKNPKYKSLATAFLAGYAGILASNYGNEVMTQYPNNHITFITLAFIFIIKEWDDKEASLTDKENKALSE